LIRPAPPDESMPRAMKQENKNWQKKMKKNIMKLNEESDLKA
jgi:hypothetical protein